MKAERTVKVTSGSGVSNQNQMTPPVLFSESVLTVAGVDGEKLGASLCCKISHLFRGNTEPLAETTLNLRNQLIN